MTSRANKYIVEDLLKPILIGQDAFNSEKLWYDMYRYLRAHGRAFGVEAISGVDIALWDIKGKALGVPVYDLLGGKCREKI